MRHKMFKVVTRHACVFGLFAAIGVQPALAAQSPLREADPIMQVPVMQMSLSRLPQWGEVQSRHASQVRNGSEAWRTAIASVRGSGDLLSAVNSYVNQARYVADSSNWGRPDYWATPTELFTRGGDCEDYAMAKYLLLRELGVAASQMRILVMRAANGIPEHAVLLVQTADNLVVLDNMRSRVYNYSRRTSQAISYAFNQSAMWLSIANVAMQ